jgi:MarR-like DNA-binding transcriptional regulator SgrR of sgrS sRNA
MDDFTIKGDFTKDDMQTILDALESWEAKDLELLETIEKLKHMNTPEEGEVPENFRESFCSFRTHMLNQESRAKKDREIRREKCTLLKAKIILMNQRKAAEQALEEASGPPWLAKKDKK